MNVFELRDHLIADYRAYVESFMRIRDPRIREYVHDSLESGALWTEPLLQLNPAFASGATIDELVAAGTLHQECQRIFRLKGDQRDFGTPLSLHKHQADAIAIARGGHNYVLTTGTGSGKSLAYIVPIVDHVLRHGPGRGIQAIVVYPMNALANSQEGELEKFLNYGYPDGKGPVTFAKYTGQESDEQRLAIMANAPDILLTNYVMLELILTRPVEKSLIDAARGLRYLVLDELHTYRGRQGADVALLVRRVRDRLESPGMRLVGTSATLAGEGSLEDQQRQVARVASQLFGAAVRPEHVIGETLRRVTPERAPGDPAFVAALKARIADPAIQPPRDYAAFVADSLSSWLESTFGVTTDAASGRLVRARPAPITSGAPSTDGAAAKLSRLTGVSQQRCAEAIKTALLAAYAVRPDPAASERDGLAGRAPFAFRLHQFISRGDVVYVSLEPTASRYITMQGQQFRPGGRDHVLLPVVFCRECGQEYLCVRRAKAEGGTRFLPRELEDAADDERGEAGFLFASADHPWPTEYESMLERLPNDWVESVNGARRVVQTRRRDQPQAVTVAPDGTAGADGLDCQFVGAPFRFCLHCGIAYDARTRSDFAKLSTLSSEGRSTATTVLSLSAVRNLRADPTLPEHARKLLSFTDNRQDASLQAGHFNDFVEIAMLRGALARAVADAPDGLTHDTLTQRVFATLNLPLEEYANEPGLKFQALRETEKALRDVLGYRLYRDLKRGWRITAPNLEQVGLLDVRYLSLDEVCADEETWRESHAALAAASPETRERVARTLLDHMRRELAIKVNYLQPDFQERLRQQSDQRLKPTSPWALDDNEAERMETATVLYPRPHRGSDDRGGVYLSSRGGFGQYLRRSGTFPNLDHRLPLAEVDQVIRDLLAGLQVAGLVEVVAPAAGAGEVHGYQVPASALLWAAGTGERPFRDPIRVPSGSDEAAAANAFFVDLYRVVAATLGGMEAHEHTAQVPYELRQEREDDFRAGRLPILYCSPTMELGVDISELNVVNLRNVPPTPANYAQRSGRAGRSGQPALVFAYCTTGSPHDQYFYRHQEAMVSGAVTPPRLDLANEDLVRSHIHAIWLAETGRTLGRSLKDLLELTGEPPGLALLPEVRDDLARPAPLASARARAARVLASLGTELTEADWYAAGWLDEVLAGAARQFDQTCDRWRTLYRAAYKQWMVQNRIIGDASRSAGDKDQAKRLRREAESQMDLLTEVRNIGESDFYSYRYFASEGFLPGYSFPRLPISAFIPARRVHTRERDEFLSRPRFLAISEFGPRSIVYHEGSRYLINKAILPVGDIEADDPRQRIALREAKLCDACGYLHPVTEDGGPDVCQRCGVVLGQPLRQLFRLQNVATKRRDRITSDEEERMRFGYEILTGVRFGEPGGHAGPRTATLADGDGAALAHLVYGSAATLWRINLGWTRRRNKDQFGFGLDLERGYWQRNDQVAAEDDPEDPMSPTVVRVIPFVEDRRNCLLFAPDQRMDVAEYASLMSALKKAIQVRYQLEDSELAAEVLPSRQVPKQILFYEAAEGGAGVLRRLLDDPEAVAELARVALDVCHFDPASGADRRRAPWAREDCEAACYDCLMSYGNQRVHQLLDRQRIRTTLLAYTHASVAASPAALPRAEHLGQLARLAGSDLEREWLRFLDQRHLRLPSRAQPLIAACGTRPDFVYDGDYGVAIYVDGPIHQYASRHARDVTQTDAMLDNGYTVIRFAHTDDWDAIVGKYPHVFGKEQS
ncbi:MAG TPA: DEAD/DEAH box helicase [Ktedonobacterales bacterium]